MKKFPSGFCKIQKMGAGYSQPPRGFHYSSAVDSMMNQRIDPDIDDDKVQFSSYKELFCHNFSIEATLPYLAEYQPQSQSFRFISYGDAYKLCIGMYNSIRALGVASGETIALYGKETLSKHILSDAAFLFGLSFVSSSPSIQTQQDFVNTMNELNIKKVFCDRELVGTSSKYSKIQFIQYPDLRSSANVQGDPLNGSFQMFCPFDPSVRITENGSLDSLKVWAKKLKICRDSRIGSCLSIGSNFERLLRMVVVSERSMIFIANGFEIMKELNPTHIAAQTKYFIELGKSIQNNVATRGFMFKTKYAPLYWWKNVKISLGGTSELSDNQVFNHLRQPLGPDHRFFLCDGSLDEEVMDLLTVSYAKPISSVFVPFQWGNFGTYHPLDPRFTKYGTYGGPVGCSITINENGICCDKSSSEIPMICEWDEEGALKIKL